MNNLSVFFTDTGLILNKSNLIGETKLIIKNGKGGKSVLSEIVENIDSKIDQEVVLNLESVRELLELKMFLFTNLTLRFRPSIYILVSKLPIQMNLFYLFLNLPILKIYLPRENVFESGLSSILKNKDFDGNNYKVIEESKFQNNFVSIEKL
jgi:hypothetical protein